MVGTRTRDAIMAASHHRRILSQQNCNGRWLSMIAGFGRKGVRVSAPHWTGLILATLIYEG